MALVVMEDISLESDRTACSRPLLSLQMHWIRPTKVSGSHPRMAHHTYDPSPQAAHDWNS
jgi:hypothetical protein